MGFLRDIIVVESRVNRQKRRVFVCAGLHVYPQTCIQAFCYPDTISPVFSDKFKTILMKENVNQCLQLSESEARTIKWMAIKRNDLLSAKQCQIK